MVSEMNSGQARLMRRPVQIDAAGATLDGELALPAVSHGVILFAHGSGSSRLSPRNELIAQVLNEGGLEPGALEQAALLARQWFLDHFGVVRS